MSWLELDDQILEHPKFIRAVNRGGGDTVFLWLGLRAYCGQQLTDGFIPEDMLDEVRGPKDPRKRKAALTALKEVGLLDEAPGGLQMHDYLDWSSSRDEVLKRRKDAAERKRRSRGVTDVGLPGESHGMSHRDYPRDSGVTATGLREESPTPTRASSPPLHSPPKPDPDPGSKQARPEDLTGSPRPKPEAGGLAETPGFVVRHGRGAGERPTMQPSLLAGRLDPRALAVPSEFREYARDLRLTERDYEDAVVDWRAKVRPSTAEHLCSTLCRFIEQRAEAIERGVSKATPRTTAEGNIKRELALVEELEAEEARKAAAV